MTEIVKLFESQLPRARQTSVEEFGKLTVLFQKTVREISTDIKIIFKIEKK